ncbi:peptide chain release factor N(5)-glutamine methyltransferase [Propionivibrio sp.]|uniref:peptide chain release factor N(5)-glutamine methyltransferase n=1 Tax=Propionivibrio sp. TaxID=2212460 RepID=UPI0025D597D6|nr:peptide chain release factor N(5)-glutamine methyltransferase [Propionivibrio sp.]MBK7355671.1 peptide chain release factor N(5)-glutamine methyltransferase [Propionivibrio sp.]MBK8400665.1 peptide chain release factor N(5)-glutamine methyltransferase [Propionivibrio sp.]
MNVAELNGSLGEAWRLACQRIERQDARLLLQHASGATHAELIAHPERALSAKQGDRFAKLVSRRASGEPLAYLLGSAYFCGLEFVVSPSVLIPRPDTEILVEQAVKRVQAWHQAPTQVAARSGDRLRIVDLGTGSGIVAIMLARRCPSVELTAVDVSAAALDVARANADRHGVQIRFLEGDWYVPLGDERFDLIVSNPPYVAAGDAHLQGNGLPFEPFDALSDGVAGSDGMACIRTLVEGAWAHLLPGGWLLIEHGYDQAVQTRTLLLQAGFDTVSSWLDGAAIERVSGGCRSPD